MPASSFFRRAFGVLAASASLWATASAAFAADGDPEKRLVIYSSHPPELVEHYAAEFGKANGIEVQVVKAGTGELLNRIKAEKARPQADLLWGGYGEVGASNPDLFETYQSPELAHVDPALQDKAQFNNAFTSGPSIIVYNKEQIGDTPLPKTWKDLTDPQWKGRIVVADPSKSASSLVGFNTLLSIYGDNDAGWGLIHGLIANAVVVQKSSLVFQQVGRGEYALGVSYEEGAYDYFAAGVAGIIYPEDGTLLQPDGLFVVKDGPSPKAARAFVDYVLSEAVQKDSVERFPGRRPSRIGLSNPALPAREGFNVIDYDPIWAAENRERILTRIQDIIVETQP